LFQVVVGMPARKDSPARRALVIGLDGAPPELVLDRWLDELPALRSLTERGTYGVLRSCDPPITVPAWACMASSRSPGALGLYGFRNRRSRAGYGLSFATARDVRVPRVWDVLSARGRPVVVLGVPPTYPPEPVRGALVSCFLAPGPATHPPGLAAELDGYRLDVDRFRTLEPARLRAALADVVDRRFRAAERLAATRAWDLLWLVEIATDRLHHRLWRSEDALLSLYRRIDRHIGRLLRHAGGDTAVLVVSDHGAQALARGVRVNEWLRREGYLALREEPAAPTPVTPGMVDWPRTRAWAEGGHYGRVFLNVAGREPAGAVRRGDVEALRDELRARLSALAPGTVVHRPDELYSEANGVPPDLLVYFGGLRLRSLGEVGRGAVLVPVDDQAGHSLDGLYVLAGPGVTPGRGGVRSLVDVAPTLLTLLGEAVPAAMEGRSMTAEVAPARR
jgi:predicted AlkP superfamily phosphohydrolase/phosphomutase